MFGNQTDSPTGDRGEESAHSPAAVGEGESTERRGKAGGSRDGVSSSGEGPGGDTLSSVGLGVGCLFEQGAESAGQDSGNVEECGFVANPLSWTSSSSGTEAVMLESGGTGWTSSSSSSSSSLSCSPAF